MNVLPKIFIGDLIGIWIEVKDFNNLFIVLSTSKKLELTNQIYDLKYFKLSVETELNSWILKKNYKCEQIIINNCNSEILNYLLNNHTKITCLNLKSVIEPLIENIFSILSNIKKFIITDRDSLHNESCNKSLIINFYKNFQKFLNNENTNLEYLDISNFQFHINFKIVNLKKLTYINFSNCNLSFCFLNSIFFNCKKLRSINISCCICFFCLKKIKSEDITNLNISGHNISNDDIIWISEKYPYLTELNVSSSLSKKCVTSLFLKCICLKKLNLSGCSFKFTDFILNAKCLKHLTIKTLLTQKDFTKILQHYNCLEYIKSFDGEYIYNKNDGFVNINQSISTRMILRKQNKL